MSDLPILYSFRRCPYAMRARMALAAAGAEVMRVRGRGRRVSLGRLLADLGNRGILSVLVEGGGVLAAEFVRRELVDELAVFQAPLLVGGDGRNMIEGLGTQDLAEAWALSVPRYERIGVDLLVQGRPERRRKK